MEDFVGLKGSTMTVKQEFQFKTLCRHCSNLLLPAEVINSTNSAQMTKNPDDEALMLAAAWQHRNSSTQIAYKNSYICKYTQMSMSGYSEATQMRNNSEAYALCHKFWWRQKLIINRITLIHRYKLNRLWQLSNTVFAAASKWEWTIVIKSSPFCI